MEEASHMDQAVFFKIILPIWMLTNCSILGISTAEDEFNFYSQLMGLKNDEGDPMFKTLRIVVACKDCIAADKGKECKHMDSFQPNWKSQRKLRMLRLIYATQQELFARENLGLLDSGKLFLFREHVARLQKSPRFAFSISPDVVWMVIDPSGGGSRSQYGLITGTFVRDKTVVIGLDRTSSAKQSQVDKMIMHQISSIRRHPRYRHSVVYVIVESNMTYIGADAIRHFLEETCPRTHAINVQPLVVVKDFDTTDKGRVGVFTGDLEKELYASKLTEVMEEGRLLLSDEFIKPHSEDTPQVLAALYEQLSNYMLEIKTPHDRVFGEAKRKFTGKIGGAFDDLAMLAQMLNFWGKKTMETDGFRKNCVQNGWVPY